MKYADTHAHLDTFANRGELEKIVERARLAGVEKIVGCSTKSDEWLLYERAAADFPGEVYWQIGIHPGEISENCEIALDSLGAFFASERPPVAIGEIGLDYYRLPADAEEFEAMKARQAEIFARQLELSNSFPDAKICVHARESLSDCVRHIGGWRRFFEGRFPLLLGDGRRSCGDKRAWGQGLLYWNYNLQKCGPDAGGHAHAGNRQANARNRLPVPCACSVARER